MATVTEKQKIQQNKEAVQIFCNGILHPTHIWRAYFYSPWITCNLANSLHSKRCLSIDQILCKAPNVSIFYSRCVDTSSFWSRSMNTPRPGAVYSLLS